MDDLEQLLQTLPKEDLVELTKYISQVAINHSLDVAKSMSEEEFRRKMMDDSFTKECKISFDKIYEPTLRRWLKAKGYAIETKD